MDGLVAVALDGGGAVVVEMEVPPSGMVKAARPGEVMGRASASLEAGLDGVVAAVRSLAGRLRDTGPSELTVEVGVKLTMEAGAVIAKSTGECNMKVVLHWDRDDVD